MANNRYKFLTKNDEYEITNLVRNAFLAAKDGKDVENVINGLLTTDEKLKIGRRIQVASMIIGGFSGEEIMKLLSVGRNTITLVSKHLSNYPKCFELVNLRSKKVEKTYKEKSYKKMGGSQLVFKKRKYTGFTRKEVES